MLAIGRVRCLATLGALLVAGACGGSSTEVQSEAGPYSLQSVNGQSLPFTITGTTLGTVVIQSATVTLTAGNPRTYTANIFGTANGGASMSLVSASGSYSRSGNSLMFSITGTAVPFAGTIKSNGDIVVGLPGPVIGASPTLTLQFDLARAFVLD